MDVDLQVLAHLRTAPAHGYDLRSRIAASVGETQALHNNLIYPALKRLRLGGDIAPQESEGDSRRTTYRITEQGGATLAALVAQISPAGVASEPDFLTCVSLLDVVPPASARRVVAARRELLASRRQHVQAVAERTTAGSWPRMVVDHQVRQLAAQQAWLDELDAATDLRA